MPKVRYNDLKSDRSLLLQVDANLRENTISLPSVFPTRTYSINNLAGIKNLTASFVSETDLKNHKGKHTAILQHTIKMNDGGSIELGVQCDLTNGEIVIPFMLKNKAGFTVGIELKATMNLSELQQNGVNLVLGVPLFGGQMILNYNPVTESFVVQFRVDQPKDNSDDTATAESTCMVFVTLNNTQGFVHQKTLNREFLTHKVESYNANYNYRREERRNEPIGNVVSSVTDTIASVWNRLTTREERKYAYN